MDSRAFFTLTDLVSKISCIEFTFTLGILVFPLFFCLSSCQRQEPKYESYRGVEYAICGDFYDQTVHVRNLEELSEHAILNFSYCLALFNDFRGLKIVNKHYNSSLFPKIGAIPLYAIEIRDSVDQISPSEVTVRRIIANLWKRNETNNLELVARGKYDISYDCE